ncbi:TfoX/Sxy family DNA transformation protein [Vibrio cholerae]|nr:TfoX/Sxy family DNA transformation protein [Vibrio cholerae]
MKVTLRSKTQAPKVTEMRYSINAPDLSLRSSLDLLNFLDGVDAHSMFGGYGLFADGVFFGFYTGGLLHLRAGESTRHTFVELGLKPHSYFKRNHLVTTNYYPVPNEWLTDLQQLKIHTMAVFEEARNEKLKSETEKDTTLRIKDLPNLKLSTEKLLKRINIETAGQLKTIGSVETFVALVENNKDIDLKMLLWLEGAITGQHWSVVSKAKRKELIASLPKHIASKYDSINLLGA